MERIIIKCNSSFVSYYLQIQGIRSEVKSMEDEPPLVTDVGPAMFSSSEVSSNSLSLAVLGATDLVRCKSGCTAIKDG